MPRVREDELRPLLLPSAERSSAGTKWRPSVLLALVVSTYFMNYVVTIVILNPYIYDKVAQQYPQFNSSSQEPCEQNMSDDRNNSTGKKIQEEILREVSTIELYLYLTSFLLASLPILVLGPLTDRYGRKVGLVFPIVGTLLKEIVYLVVISQKLPPLWLLVGHVMEACGGSFAAMLSSMFSIVSDISPPGRRRSLHITCMEALQTIATSAAQIAIGHWIKVSYFYPVVCSVAVNFLCLLLVLVFLPETAETTRLVAPTDTRLEPGCCRRICVGFCSGAKSSLQMIKQSLMLYVKDVRGKRLVLKRRLVFVTFILTVAVNFSKPGVQNLYLMKYPLCWGATKLLTYNGATLLCNWVAILALLAILQRLFNMADRQAAVLGVISSMTACVFMSVAVNDTMVYEVAVLSVMTRAIIPMLRSVMTTLVDERAQGTVYAGMGCIETIGASVFGTAANRIFYASLATWPGLVFVLFAIVMLVALTLLIILNVLYSREEVRRPQHQTYEPINGSNSINREAEVDPSW
ncbi:proton-coupled folate transporter-like [Physella acuta]|uniref:proton-coupled folate transporter-like n=1 Tax=Physella acuta TaxID=109671 RepID=UPI0027DB0C81|nr:proton-coupled folate transporter-like [Physella acuta]